MRTVRILLAPLVAAALILSCAGMPEKPVPLPGDPPPADVMPPPPPPGQAFDPASITPEVKRDTMEEVKSFINVVNQVIRQKDYTVWRGYLTPEYSTFYSSPAVLAEMSESAVLKRQGIKLESLQDYFLYVVYPSRQSVRVDDIEFTSPTQVKAVTITPSGDRQVYYYLEKVGESWKIGTGR